MAVSRQSISRCDRVDEASPMLKVFISMISQTKIQDYQQQIQYARIKANVLIKYPRN
ncbi:MAG: hypothetical protein HC908_14445 [Calothrix sp. SM1_7_51]|nr:hypothetical protein [Calothrix sp. SM1_7_51]